jgi:hypothetical protein
MTVQITDFWLWLFSFLIAADAVINLVLTFVKWKVYRLTQALITKK